VPHAASKLAPDGRVLVEIDSGITAAAIATAKILLVVCTGGLEPCAFIVTEKEPDCVGVALIAHSAIPHFVEFHLAIPE
jgi:hypothetical protein